ncbi:Asp-tRNA(Asn)/Glu-tRNA(Gln) amidotransferase subunit GatC [Fructilactobacillus fructivorans]|uniref:Aspartyl/glutamyl-tRNA(Asn/Gln) amidotransferase subunit C n=1 Tax=Fructilactobacillus fructivorans TaxID=1614 RepID=A0A0C1PN59_9LACO|nr:Asp-tRNA(Asn)/Glu-tRNA(Gln) amidotransferase subunit GatC [Fructilactobacillus fructivorans]KID41356.1 Aspartyl-tRNA(Asn) amidotransferase subunit C Glutamyl-tRNA(Gln) amidotransferase subunit C [Fructilactobacillus fructivorans]KRK57076.1 aspartyl glutamyl-tRNA amidotransferase subunit C [Fructilactobacillus fructivorans]KRN12215.1 aspartyl glutamyl-tRNA amidotransferase subunit C [Fructilactobacillus fructivorans]KRN42685.1 aspartyl glutamyl-tRNA amidotransferase subunit C [Fructilactobaci
MADKITEEQTQHIAGLAKLELKQAELPEFTQQLNDLLKMLDTLEKVDTTGVEPTYTVTDQINVTRKDIAEDWGERDALLKNAPDTSDGLIKVPAIIDESEDE